MVLISVREYVDPMTTVRPEGVMSMINSSNTIGNRTSDSPACSAVSINGGYVCFYLKRYSEVLERVPSVSDNLAYQFACLAIVFGHRLSTSDALFCSPKKKR